MPTHRQDDIYLSPRYSDSLIISTLAKEGYLIKKTVNLYTLMSSYFSNKNESMNLRINKSDIESFLIKSNLLKSDKNISKNTKELSKAFKLQISRSMLHTNYISASDSYFFNQECRRSEAHKDYLPAVSDYSKFKTEYGAWTFNMQTNLTRGYLYHLNKLSIRTKREIFNEFVELLNLNQVPNDDRNRNLEKFFKEIKDVSC